MRRLLFLAIVLLELTHTAVAVWQHRVPAGHDGFQFFTLQYFFLNNAIQSHEIAQWIPFMTEGTVASLWYGIQGSLLQNVLVRTGSLLAHTDLLAVYHAGMLVDELILLVGTWLLARRFFDVPTVFFIAVTIVGSSIWLDQPYWNFRLYFAIPLVLELGHRFLESGRWRWFALGVNLLALQSLGNLPYLIPVLSFSVFAYFACFAAATPGFFWQRLRALKWGVPALAAIVLGAVSFAVAYKCFTIGAEQLVNYNLGRNPDGSTDINGFMTYGGLTDLRKWIEVVMNVSPWFDITLYSGVLILPLLLCGLITVDRRRLHFVLFAATLLMFTLATPFSRLLYYAWPGMRYFRHIGLVSPLVRVFACFVAGVGFEKLTTTQDGRGRWVVRVCAVGGALVLLIAGMLILNLARSQPAIGRYVEGLLAASMSPPVHLDVEILSRRLRSSASMAFLGAAMLASIPLLLSRVRVSRTRLLQQGLIAALLVFVVVDVYQFKFRYLFERSEIIRSQELSTVLPTPMPYARRREIDLHQAVIRTPRLLATFAFNRMLLQRFEGHASLGAQYWSNNAFWFVDELGATLQADSWLEPLDELIRMYRGETLHPPPHIRLTEEGRLDFSLARFGATDVVGVRSHKVRFFTRAYAVASEDEFVAPMTDPAFGGGLLFVLPPDDRSDQATSLEPWRSQVLPGSDETRVLDYTVRQFDANNLVVSVVNPEATPMWMSYADVWHPSWHATVNGRTVPVYRAEMAYKAVEMEPGENLIHFHFGSPLFTMLAALVSLNSAFWLCAIAALGVRPRSDPKLAPKHTQ